MLKNLFSQFNNVSERKALSLPITLNELIKMKKVVFIVLLFTIGLTYASAQKQAEIKFDKMTYNFGEFSENAPKVTCVFRFTNTGDDLLIIHQAIASCGCTIPAYTKEPIKPGETGEVKVTYNGAGKLPGHFKKSITVRSNAKTDTVRLYVEGNMLPKDK